MLWLLLGDGIRRQGESQGCEAPGCLHPSPCADEAGCGLERRGFLGLLRRLRWLRWRRVVVRGRWQEPLGVIEGGAPVVAVALQVFFPPPHIGQHGLQLGDLRFEQLRDAIWCAVVVRWWLRWWQRRKDLEQFHGLDVPASVVIARRTDASGLDGAQH